MQDSSYFAVCGPDTCAWLFEWKLLGITVKWRAVLTSGSLSFFVQIMKSWRVIKTEGYFQVVLFVYFESKSDSFWVIKNNQLDPHPPACFSWFSSSSRSSILTLLTPRKNNLRVNLSITIQNCKGELSTPFVVNFQSTTYCYKIKETVHNRSLCALRHFILTWISVFVFCLPQCF